MKHEQMEGDPPPGPESGIPGGGRGRREVAGGLGVYPASAGHAPPGAVPRTQAEWGQGDRGAAGYDDSAGTGRSFIPAPRPVDTPPAAGETPAPTEESGGHPPVTPLTHEEIAEWRSRSWGGW